MGEECDAPGNRIGDKQHPWGVEPVDLENGSNPNKTKSAGTYDRHDGWHRAIAKTADGTYNGIHHATQKVSGTYNAQS